MKLFIATVGLVLLAESINAVGHSPAKADFESYKAFHGKTYPTAAAEAQAKANFNSHSAHISAHNNAHAKGEVSFAKELNEFADIAPAVFNQRNGYKPANAGSSGQITNRAIEQSESHYQVRAALPAAFDWRNSSKVSPVLNQGSCGSCWAFSTTAAMESQVLIQGKSLMQFSQQQLVDCDTNDGGCNGGSFQGAYSYIKSNGGIDSAASYPYTSSNGVSGTCNFKSASVTATISSYVTLPNNYTAIMTALVNKGPMAIAIDASQGLQTYSSGVYKCSSTPSLDHGVVLVGYGATSSGQQYWIVKNSWGTGFGYSGFFYLARGTGDCGMSQAACQPTVTVTSSSG